MREEKVFFGNTAQLYKARLGPPSYLSNLVEQPIIYRFGKQKTWNLTKLICNGCH